jgi:hypothetical protein
MQYNALWLTCVLREQADQTLRKIFNAQPEQFCDLATPLLRIHGQALAHATALAIF